VSTQYAGVQGLSVYPDPVTDVMNFSIPDAGDYHLSVTDVLGREVYGSTVVVAVSGLVTLPASMLAPGIYILSVQSHERCFRQRIIKK
jgi:Secretion system C-terminal sorting domain